MSYVAEVSRGWDEPNARDMGRMTSQPNATDEMYILNDDIDMKAEIAAMERRLEKLEMMNMQPVQAISQTPLQPMPCAICLSYEHLVDDHLKIETCSSTTKQASILEQAMMNLSKIVGDFVGAQEAINAQVDQRLDRMESMLNKRMDEMQNDMNQKFDNIQYSISSIHEVEAQEGESSMVKEIEEVITLRSGKEVDLPTCKLEHKVWSETEKENREEIKGKKKGKSIEKDDYDFDIDEEPQRKVIKEEMMKRMPRPFLQALFWMIKIKRNCKEIEEKIGAKSSKIESNRAKREKSSAKFRRMKETSAKWAFCCQTIPQHRSLCEGFSQLRKWGLAHECHSKDKSTNFAKRLQSMKDPISQENLIWRRFGSYMTLISHCENGCKFSFFKKKKKKNFAAKAPFRRVFGSCETHLWHTSATSQHTSNGARFGFETEKLWPFEDDCANHERKCRTSILLLLDTFLKHFLELKLCIRYLVSKLRKSGVHSFKRYQLRAPVEETMPSKETTKAEAKVLIQPIQEATTDTSAPQDLTIT
ncbi:hypothetical protein AAG906_039158 [Vitis piasezkii]